MKMTKISLFNVAYDSGADVLYISTTKAPASSGTEDNLGILWRHGADGKLIGATIMDFHEMWSQRTQLLATEIARQFEIAPYQAQNVVDQALDIS
jgi:uncharacterized protein YuzE